MFLNGLSPRSIVISLVRNTLYVSLEQERRGFGRPMGTITSSYRFDMSARSQNMMLCYHC